MRGRFAGLFAILAIVCTQRSPGQTKPTWIDLDRDPNHAAAKSALEQVPVDYSNWGRDLVLVFLKPPGTPPRGSDYYWHAPHLNRNAPATLHVVYPDGYAPTVTITGINYGPSELPSPLARPPGERSEYYASTWVFTPTGDDAQVEAVIEPVGPDDNKKALPRLSFSQLVPVDIPLFSAPPKISFSVGLLWSRLHDQAITLMPTAGESGTSTIAAGVGDADRPKGIALIHFTFYKRGDCLLGPCIGVTTSGDTAGYFLGASYLFGKRDRLALNLGVEYGKVNRLSGYSIGDSVPNGTGVTQSVWRGSSLGLSLSYAFTGGN